jgi:poly(A) polymerase
LVGGPVRDAFLGREVHDLDFTTSARPMTLSDRRPLAKAVWDVGRDFGTIAAQIGSETVEITTYPLRLLRRIRVVNRTSLLAILWRRILERRDFTMNAMALTLPGLVLVDPFGGLEDLLALSLTTPMAPEVSFDDDPLAHDACCAFLANWGPNAPATRGSHDRDGLSDCRYFRRASARRAGEDFVVRQPPARFGGARGQRDSRVVLPELPALRLETDEHAHHKDVYQHTLTVVEQAIDEENAGFPAPILMWCCG